MLTNVALHMFGKVLIIDQIRSKLVSESLSILSMSIGKLKDYKRWLVQHVITGAIMVWPDLV